VSLFVKCINSAGANPGDIPYCKASKFELSLNLKTAKAPGLTVPATRW
jgi:putative ABC transport system substrate-binding protein